MEKIRVFILLEAIFTIAISLVMFSWMKTGNRLSDTKKILIIIASAITWNIFAFYIIDKI
jgi:hypothetical protein